METNQTPHQPEAEMSVLGAVFLDGQCLKTVSGYIDGADFHGDKHRHIFQAMLQSQITETPIDTVTIAAALKENGHLDGCGGAAYLYALSEYVPTSANVAHYCKLVKEASVKRQVIAYGRELMQAGMSGAKVVDVLKSAKEDLAAMASSMDSFGGVSVKDIMAVDDRAARYAHHVQTLDKARFITGHYLLDSIIRGVAPGEVMTIIAEPGGFKTAWLQNLLLGGAKRTGLYHLFFSLEMPVEKVFEREAQISSGYTGREVEKIFKAAPTDKQAAGDLYKQAVVNGSKGLLVCDRPRIDLAKIARYTELAATKYGKINAIGVDYLGLMQAPGKSLFEKTQHLAPEFKHLAKELGLPIIILCQINREGAKAAHDILITDAKGGGDIEASADIMLGFYRDAEDTLICKILKNRNGASGARLAVELNREAFQFIKMTEYETPQPQRSGAVPRKKTAEYGGLPA